jgi:hypothetical protein
MVVGGTRNGGSKLAYRHDKIGHNKIQVCLPRGPGAKPLAFPVTALAWDGASDGARTRDLRRDRPAL